MNALITATPIDTGYARSRWSHEVEEVFKVTFSIRNPFLVKFNEVRDVVINDAAYIQYLNQGWSKQAPPRFIEQTILQQGFTPVQLI